VRNGKYAEKGLVTSGDSLSDIGRFLPSNGAAYSAAEVVTQLLHG